MAEIEIRRVNFFDGQFLREAEFNDLSDYMVHMRRRLLFMLFGQSGVVQIGDAPLTIRCDEGKRIRVTAGTAIGMRADAVEAKEIILAQDTGPIDLSAQGPMVPEALQAGDTGIVTIHYDEVGVKDPASEGDVQKETRIIEKAIITVHRNQVNAINPKSGEPLIRLGDVNFDTMAFDTTQRQETFLRTTLLAGTPSISVAQTEVTAGGQITLNVSSFGGFKLLGATNNNVEITPSVGTITVQNVAQTSLELRFTLDADAQPGSRRLKITVNNVSAETTFLVQTPLTVTGFERVRPEDQTFTVKGTGFQSPVNVRFAKASGGLTEEVAFSVANDTAINCQIRNISQDAKSGFVEVKSGQRAARSTDAVVPPPEITELSSIVLSPGDTLTIKGKRLFPGTGNPKVEFVTSSTIEFTNPQQANDEIRVKIPQSAGSRTGKIRVTTGGGTAQFSENLRVQ